MTDFEPVVIVNYGILLLLVRKELPVSTLAEFIAYAKVNQKKMQFGSAGGRLYQPNGVRVAHHRHGHEHNAGSLSW